MTTTEIQLRRAGVALLQEMMKPNNVENTVAAAHQMLDAINASQAAEHAEQTKNALIELHSAKEASA